MRRLGISAAAAVVVLSAAAASAQPAPTFAKKVVTIYIANAAAGSYDIYGRAMGRHLGNHLPGNPSVVVSNMPGGGGLVAANHLYNVAPKDGTALGVLIETVAISQALRDPQVKYDASKFNWIGRVASSNNIHFQWYTSKVHTIEDAQSVETTVGGTGAGNMGEIMPKVLNGVIGTKFKIISGYQSSTDAMLAMERGEVEGALSAWETVKTSKQDWLKDKKIRIILQDVPERAADLPDVPAIVEMGKTPEEKGVLGIFASNGVIGRSLVAPPDMPREVVKALRDGFDAMVADADFVSDLKKIHVDLDPVPGATLQANAVKLLDIPDSVREKAMSVFGR